MAGIADMADGSFDRHDRPDRNDRLPRRHNHIPPRRRPTPIPLQLHPRPLYAVVGILAAYNLIATAVFRRVRHRRVLGERAPGLATAEHAGPVSGVLLPPLPAFAGSE